jgi:hypothetical protein
MPYKCRYTGVCRAFLVCKNGRPLHYHSVKMAKFSLPVRIFLTRDKTL